MRHHHERWDGGGYPAGLAGEEIPLISRIVGACDAFSAMTTDRPYRDALPIEVALAELHGGAGTQFDSHVVTVLVRVLSRDPELGLAGQTSDHARALDLIGRHSMTGDQSTPGGSRSEALLART